jgi:hypothetical protein
MTHIKANWRGLLAGLPLPMLALAASYGVYSFALLFVPPWVAITQAAAFEMCYIGLAVLVGLNEDQRRRAGYISVGAVAVSIIYNSMAGFFHRQAEALAALPWWGDAILSALHGAPLALVAYFVADLLLHRETQEARAEVAPMPAPVLTYARIADAPMPVAHEAPKASSKATRPLVCPACSATLSTGEYGAARRWGKCRHCR